MAKVKVIKKLLKGIGSLFKERGEEVPALFKTPTKDPEFGTRVFFNNLLEEFGEKQVKESVEITRNAWKKKTFFPGGPQGDRFEDDLVNLLETRYMSSDRLQAHPLSFNRRGAGAADRYKMPKLGQQIEMGNKKRTDLPGGPGDPDLYKNRWGEMSDNVNPITKKKIYDKPPSILDEYSDDVIARIKGNQNVSPEDINKAYDIKMGQREMARGKKSIFDHPYVKEAEEKAGWGYKKKDDEGILKSLRKAADEELDKVRLQSKQMNAAANQVTMMTNRMVELAKKGDMENAEKIRDAIEEYRLKVQSSRGTIIDDFPILIDPTRKPNAKGGRVGLFNGGEPIADLAMPMTMDEILDRAQVYTDNFKDYNQWIGDQGLDRVKEAVDAYNDLNISYAAPYYERDAEGNKIYPLGTEIADIMQRGMPPVPGLELSREGDKVVKEDMLDYERAYEQALGERFPDIYKRVNKLPDMDPNTLGSYLDDVYFDSGEQFGNRVALNWPGFGADFESGERSVGETIAHEFVHNLLGREKESLGYKIAPSKDTDGMYDEERMKATQLQKIDREIDDLQEKLLEAGAYDNPGEERMARRFTDILTDMIGKREGTDEEALDRMLEKGTTSYSDHIYGYGDADFEQALQEMRDKGLEPTEDFVQRFLGNNKGWWPFRDGGRVGMFRGGLAALLRRINPSLEKQMVETGPFQTGHRADAIADMEQIKNITRNEATDLERIYELEDMIQNSPRYNDKMKNALLNLIDYEKFRANKLYDNPKLQKHMKADPEGTEAYLRWLYRSEGSDSGFNMGGRVGMFTGGIPLAHRGIGYLWRAIKEAAEQAGKISGRTGGKYKIGDIDYLFKRSPRSKFTKEDAAGVMNPRWGRKYGLFGRGLPRVITKEQEKMIKLLREFGEDYADGGRVGMFAGGSLIGKGIMEAAKLAQRGMKPFGAKQTYKQNVTQKGVSNEQFDEIFKKQLNRVPDEVVDEPTGRGLNSSLLEAEAILTGQKFGLLTQAQRTKIAQAMRDKVAKQIYDDPNPRLSNDYFEYMDNAVGRMDAILEIERLGGDLRPKPIYDGKEIIAAGIDFRQLDELEKGAKIIPFKPRTKKFMGGILSDAELANPKYNSNTGEYEIGGGVKLGNLELDMLARGLEGYDPIMQYEGMLDLGNDFMLKGGYYDDAIMEPGMMSPEDEIKFLLTKGFANGGTVPPQKGPMSDGMGSLFRSK